MKEHTRSLLRISSGVVVASVVWAGLSFAMGDYNVVSHVWMTALFGALYYLMTIIRRS